MHDFVFKEIINSDIENELCKIGFDKSYVKKLVTNMSIKI